MKVKLSQARLADLYGVLGSLPPSEIGDLKAIRKIDGALTALEKVCKPYLDKSEKIQEEVRKISVSFQTAKQELDNRIKTAKEEEKLALEAEKISVEQKANKDLEPINKKFTDLAEKDGKVEVEVDLDENYATEVKEQFKKHATKLYRNVKAYLATADALGIEE